MLNIDILTFVSHLYNCDAIQPMWHKGPCDCGLYALLDKLLSIGLSPHHRSIESLTLLYQLRKSVTRALVTDWEKANKKRLPEELFRCLRCDNVTAEKQHDVQGWDSFCHCCGMIAQSQVGELVFTTACRISDDDTKQKEQ